MDTQAYRLSPMQRAVLFQNLRDSDGGFYIQQVVCTLRETLDEGALQLAWNEVVRRYPTLRTGFRWEHVAQPLQIANPPREVRITRTDLRSLSPDEQASEFDAALRRDRSRGFDISNPPLMRVALFRIGDADYRMVWTAHVALLDGRSRYIVLEELFETYERLREGREIDLAPAPAYRDYVRWLQAQELSQEQAFFSENYRDLKAQSPLCIQRFDGDRTDHGQIQRRIDHETTERLTRFANAHDCTVNTVVQTAWASLLHQYRSGDEDQIVIGATRACRHLPIEGIERMVGFMVNTLPVRTHVGPDVSIVDMLADIRRQWLALRRFEHTPLQKIYEWLDLPAGAALFDTIIVAENFDLNHRLRAKGGAWKNRSFEVVERTDYLSLATSIDDGLNLEIEYDERQFGGSSVELLMDHLETLVESVPTTAKLGDMPLPADPTTLASGRIRRDLTGEERQTIVVDWNQTQASFPAETCVQDLLAQRTEINPDAVAVGTPYGTLTFEELDRLANRLAHKLRDLGVGPETKVAIRMQHSRELLVAMLGVLRAGGAYVPIDVAYPADRAGFILHDADVTAMITQTELLETLAVGALPVVAIDPEFLALAGAPEVEPPREVGPRNLAYIIYTSGSTGKPKGVQVEHRNLIHLCAHYWRALDIQSHDRATFVSGTAFDAAVADVWPFLSAGASTHTAPPEARTDPRLLVRWLKEQEITCSFVPTALGEAAFRLPWPDTPALRAVLVGGDKLHYCPDQKLPFRLINSYGPTECTVDSTWGDVESGVPVPTEPTIGQPITNATAYIVDREMEPVPVGVPGELLIGGAGVARGYLCRPELNAERFIADPFSDDPKARLYRTGDQVRWTPNGEIEFIGRYDDQVQIRGFRVELGEIENAVAGHPDVEVTAVLAREDQPGRKRLVAYVVPAGSGKGLGPRLRAHVGASLPPYMVPVFVILDEFPMNASGKIDRRALKPPEQYPGFQGDDEAAQPRDDVERAIQAIWKDLLQTERVTMTDRFFDLGGDSLSAVNLLVSIEDAMGVSVPVQALLADPTVQALARVVRGDADDVTGPSVVALQQAGSLPPMFCVAGAGGGSYWFGHLSDSLGLDQPLYGLEPSLPDPATGLAPTLENTARLLIQKMKEIQPRGPYYLGGYSLGGYTAYEIARQLKESGEKVNLLVMFEAFAEQDFMSKQEKLKLYAENFMRLGLTEAASQLKSKAAWLVENARAKVAPSSGSADDSEVKKQHREATAAMIEAAMSAYQLRAYLGRIVLFRAQTPMLSAPRDIDYGWGKWATDGVERHTIPGDHYSIFAPPQVHQMARALRMALDKARALPGAEAAQPAE